MISYGVGVTVGTDTVGVEIAVVMLPFMVFLNVQMLVAKLIGLFAVAMTWLKKVIAFAACTVDALET